jgi:hypothetical protein
MNIDEKISLVRQMRIEGDTKLAESSIVEQGLLREIQIELDGLRRQAAMRSARTFSEREMAQWLGCNERQLRVYRLKHRETVKPIMVTRTPRYSTWHQVDAQEIFQGLSRLKRKQSKRSEARGQRSENGNVISDSRLQISERRIG